MQSLQTFVLSADYITIMMRATSAPPPGPADENASGLGQELPNAFRGMLRCTKLSQSDCGPRAALIGHEV